MSLDKLMADINKKYGEGALVRGADARGLKIDRLKTGSLSLDIATGGGWAMGKINEIFGPYCLDGDSIVNYHLPHWKEKRGNPRVRQTSISQLFKINLKSEEIYLESVDEVTGEIILNRVVNVVQSGVKILYKVTTEHGFTLNTTLDHFYKTPMNYQKLKWLKVGDIIAVADRRNTFNTSKERKKKEINVRWHPTIQPRKHSQVTGALGGQGVRGGKYVRMYEHRLVVEAAMNNLSVKEYINVLNNYTGEVLVVIPEGMEVHHKDFDYTNNREDNLELMWSEDHAKLHSNRNQACKNLLWDRIVSIDPLHEKETYDIAMLSPHNNFLANNIVVHNSGGKTYVSLLTVAQTQKDYPNSNVAWIDFEGAFDKDWAHAIGVDTDKLLISSPEYMEDGLQIASELIQSGDVILLVVDSLAAACPKAEYEGDISDFTVGLRARLGNKFIRKSKPKSNLLSDEVDLGKTTLLLINQIYAGIGPYAGEETPGGVQVKFGAMVRVRIRKGDLLQDKDGAVLMQESRFTVEKNKTYPPKKTGSFSFSCKDNSKGKAGQIYRAGEIITFGVLTGVIRKAAAWLYLPESLGGEKFQGADKLSEWIDNNPEEYLKLEELVVASIKETSW